MTIVLSKMIIESITGGEINEAKKVLEDHVVKPLTEEGALESGIFCIASQANDWEMASKIIYALRDHSGNGSTNARERITSMKTITDATLVEKIAEKNGWRFHHEKRFTPFINYFSDAPVGWWSQIREAHIDQRTEYVRDIKYIGDKTFSFWNICLGGTKLLALDVHVMRGLTNLGIQMNENYVIPKLRKKKTGNGYQKVRKTPPTKDYLRIEREARNLFREDGRFFNDSEGEVNLALVDAVLWWKGAKRQDSGQAYLFSDWRESHALPYAGIRPQAA